MLVAVVLTLPIVCSLDVISFDPDFYDDSAFPFDRNDVSNLNFNRNVNVKSETSIWDEVSEPVLLIDSPVQDYTQNFPKPLEDLQDETNEKNKVNIRALAKEYLSKLYNKKYSNDDQKGKWGGDSSIDHLKNKTKSFANKFLSLFYVVKFPNGQCQTPTIYGNYLGTCYHQTECGSLNGTALGKCADGYGVCCVFKASCGSTSSRNCTYFESPGYPEYDPPDSMVLPPTTVPPVPITPDPRLSYYNKLNRWGRQSGSSTTCTLNIYKQSNNIQQFRIDFIDLELRAPTMGTCMQERLVITGQNVNDQIPMICGYNTGQHVYVDVSDLRGPLQLSVLSTTGERKRFKIRICQIAQSCTNSNCLQYYTGATGTISSFNYDQAALANRSSPGYFNNLNYAICIRKEAGYCSITYSNIASGLEYPFNLVNFNQAGQSTVPTGQAGADVVNCPSDYVVIGGVRLCGYKLNDGSVIQDFRMNAPVTDSSAGPIVIPVRTNSAATGRGFKLFYTQNRCPNT